MDSLEQSQPTKTETRHFNIGVTTDYLKTQEKRLGSLGPRDEKTTSIFQNYHLPDQEFVREQTDGEKVKVVRSLVDPEEYVLPLDKAKGSNQLVEIVREDQRGLAKGWKKNGLEGEPPLYSSSDIILGKPEIPETCYRYKLQDVQVGEASGEISLVVEQNIEHEKEKGAFVPFGAVDSKGEQEPEEQKKEENPDTTPSSMTIVNEEDFADSQKDLMKKGNLPSSIAFGRRTGNLIAHQRAPQDMTRFSDNVARLKINTQTDNVWIVVVSADAVEKQRTQDK